MKELIEKAIEKLNIIKGLNLTLYDFILEKPGTVNLQILDKNAQCPIFVSLKISDVCDIRHSDEPQHLSILDIRILRIARVIYDEYKKLKNILINDSLTVNSNQTVSSLKIGSATYDIGVNGRSLTATFDEVDELKNKVKDLEDINNKLTNEVGYLKAILQAKGIL